MTGLRIVCLSAVLLLGGLHAWSSRHAGNIDGISYLDLSDAVSSGDWTAAVNAHWSPLYPAALALALRVAAPGPYWEFATVHAVNFAIFCLALAAFDFLLREAVRDRHRRDDEAAGLPAAAITGLGYLLFLWASLQLVTLSVMSPDMAVAAIVFLVAGLVLSIRRGRRSAVRFGLLGAVLGVGYLVKAPLFPLAFVFVLLAWASVAAGQWRVATSRAAVALTVFALVAGPYVVAVSLAKGRPTFGESGRLAYAWFVNGVPFRHWQGGLPAAGEATHPTRRLLDTPTLYEFATPIGGTYPVWFDPSYWYDGIRPRLDAGDLARTLGANARELSDMALSWVQGGLGLFCIALLVFGGAARTSVAGVRQQWTLLVPALAGLGLYSMVSVFPRYIAPFLVLLWLGVLLGLRVGPRPRFRLVASWGAAAVALLLAVHLAREVGPRAVDGALDLWHGDDRAEHTLWQVADGLGAHGIRAGDRVAILHPDPARASWIGAIGWARLGRVRIVAEVPPEHAASYWAASIETRQRVHRALEAAGARAVVTMRPPGHPGAEWHPIGATGYFILSLAPPKSAVHSS
ncbi:MAG: hypothetical protein AB7U83_00125 [Vicinamibacterales bacterium]